MLNEAASGPQPQPLSRGVRAWVGWLLRSLGLLVGLAIAVGVAVLVPANLIGWTASGSDPVGTAYAWSLTALPVSWPLYVGVLALVAPRVRRPRRWAIALSPLLGVWFALLLFFTIDLPDFYAGWLLWLSFGALVPLPPSVRSRAQSGGETPGAAAV